MEILVGILGLILGILSTLIFQVYQSKESIKLTIYKEKLVVYEKIMESLAFIGFEMSKTIGDEPAPDMAVIKKQSENLMIVSNTYAHYLPRNLLAKCIGYSLYLLEQDKIDKNIFKVVIERNYGGHIYNIIREDLGMEPLSKELKELFVSYPTLKIKSNLK